MTLPLLPLIPGIAPAPTPATIELVFDIPPNLWLSSNRLPTNRNHLNSIGDSLHELAGWVSLAAGHRTTLAYPVAVLWSVCYAPGTGRADPSNAQPTTKRLLDGLVTRTLQGITLPGLLEDDDSEHVVAETFVRGPNCVRDRTIPKHVPRNRRIICTLTPVTLAETN